MIRSSPLRTGRTQEFSWYLFLEAESTPGHMVPSVASEKSPANPLGIDPETLRLVAQCLNHYATPGPYLTRGHDRFLNTSKFTFHDDHLTRSYSQAAGTVYKYSILNSYYCVWWWWWIIWQPRTTTLQARSQNCEKRVLASSCLSVLPHGTTRIPPDGFQ
jgi:hypothetical protein